MNQSRRRSKAMSTIKISQSDYETLVWLGKNYYSHPDAKPVAPEEILHRLIEHESREAIPPDEHNFGRQ